jgi:hypothetical protein
MSDYSPVEIENRHIFMDHLPAQLTRVAFRRHQRKQIDRPPRKPSPQHPSDFPAIEIAPQRLHLFCSEAHQRVLTLKTGSAFERVV